MNKCHVVVATDAVSESREFFFHSDNFHRFGEGVPDVSEFVVGGVVGDE